MATINDIYIDKIHINKARTSTGNNTLTGASAYTGITSTGGYEWICAIVNKHASATFTFGSTHYLNICTNFLENGASSLTEDIDDNDIDMSLNGVSITNGEIMYVGFDFTGDGVELKNGINGGTLLGDQKLDLGNAEEDIVAASRFNILVVTGSGFSLNRSIIDTCGANDLASSQVGIYYYLYDTVSLSASGSIRRDPTSTYPSNSFVTTDWRTSTGLSFLTSSAAGDPHIKTLNEEFYEFDYLGAFRLLEDTIDGENLIINALSEPGPTRWEKNQYIRKLFIQKGEKHMLVDLGFRGEQVKVIEENGFEYTEEKLEFHKNAKRYSLTTNYKTKSRKVPVSDTLPELIRNQISFTINDKHKSPLLSVELSNVNEFNLQPCRVNINLAKKDGCSKNAKGCLVSRFHANASKLNDIKCLDLIDSTDILNVKDVPKLEVDPSLVNAQWE
jgi:hypothetical protein